MRSPAIKIEDHGTNTGLLCGICMLGVGDGMVTLS